MSNSMPSFGGKADSSVVRAPKDPTTSFTFKGLYKVECVDAEGNQKWVEEGHNVVSFVGMVYLLNAGFNAGTPSTTWYMGLIDGTTVSSAEGDTMAVPSFTEEAAYSSPVTRPEWTCGNAAAGASTVTMTNASVVEFTMSGTTNVAGIFIVDNNTISGTSGTLWAAAAFGSYQAVNSGDILRVTYTITADNA